MKTLKEFLDEGMVDTIQKGVKRHKDAIEKKKIKNRKAVPYAALAAQHEPQGDQLDETLPLRSRIKSVSRSDMEKMAMDDHKRALQKRVDQSTKNRGDLKKRDAGAMARDKMREKDSWYTREEKVNEAKVDTGKSADEKATARNQRNNPKKGDPGFGKFATSAFIKRKEGQSLAWGKDSAASELRRKAHGERRGVKEGKIADALRRTIADMKAADRKAGLLPGGKDVVDLDVERERRRKKKVDEEVGVASSTVAMKKAQKEAELRKKEQEAVKKAKKVSEAKVDHVDYVISQLKKVSEARIQVESATHPEKFSMKKFAQGLEKKHGKGTVLSKYTSKPKPPTEAEKREYAAHKAKIAGEDRRDDLEKATDGRYSRKYSNRGSD